MEVGPRWRRAGRTQAVTRWRSLWRPSPDPGSWNEMNRNSTEHSCGSGLFQRSTVGRHSSLLTGSTPEDLLFWR
ncbi:hypothetical protein GJAV_G00094260 [Gymnothorax javanicus]|nr:hypothetical protein GJAV_G00094260 [Gymnothorax javanicus]